MRGFHAVILGAGLLLGACNVGQYEEPAYHATRAEGQAELRHYGPVIAAQVVVTGTREEAVSTGFRQIADYIFGNNQSRTEISMTAPVVQQSESIAMTAPVLQQGEGDRWVVQFIMPREYTLQTLPKPVNNAVKLRSIPARDVAVIRFSGDAKDAALLEEKTAELRRYIAQQGLRVRGATPLYAFYDPPWTLPFLRRNEVMLEVVAPKKR